MLIKHLVHYSLVSHVPVVWCKLGNTFYVTATSKAVLGPGPCLSSRCSAPSKGLWGHTNGYGDQTRNLTRNYNSCSCSQEETVEAGVNSVSKRRSSSWEEERGRIRRGSLFCSRTGEERDINHKRGKNYPVPCTWPSSKRGKKISPISQVSKFLPACSNVGNVRANDL